MLIVKSPFRISLFGGSTDYKGFYEQYGSFLIGTPIDKYCYISMRYRPEILSKQYLCTYSKYELVDSINDFKNIESINLNLDSTGQLVDSKDLNIFKSSLFVYINLNNH